MGGLEIIKLLQTNQSGFQKARNLRNPLTLLQASHLQTISQVVLKIMRCLLRQRALHLNHSILRNRRMEKTVKALIPKLNHLLIQKQISQREGNQKAEVVEEEEVVEAEEEIKATEMIRLKETISNTTLKIKKVLTLVTEVAKEVIEAGVEQEEEELKIITLMMVPKINIILIMRVRAIPPHIKKNPKLKEAEVSHREAQASLEIMTEEPINREMQIISKRESKKDKDLKVDPKQTEIYSLSLPLQSLKNNGERN